MFPWSPKYVAIKDNSSTGWCLYQGRSLLAMPGQEVAPGCVLGPPPEIHNAPLSVTELAESQEGRQYGSYLEHLEEMNPLL